ncbi:MAG: hypothetical protein AB1411_07525 [Nitrospirota bacterium]
MKRLIPYLILGLVAVQVILAVAAAACLFDHAASHHAGHHHQSKAHSTLCAWACQANPGSGFAETALPVQPILLALFFLSVSVSTLSGFRLYHLAPRGPPFLD